MSILASKVLCPSLTLWLSGEERFRIRRQTGSGVGLSTDLGGKDRGFFRLASLLGGSLELERG